MSGYIYLHRRITHHPFWMKKRVFSMFEAWLDLLFEAAYEPHETYIGSTKIWLDYGDVPHSQRALSARWGWGLGKTNRFLKCLETETMVERKTEHQTTIYSIVNYATYQMKDVGSGTQDETKVERKRNANGTNIIKGSKGIKKTNSAIANFEAQFTDPNYQQILAHWKSLGQVPDLNAQDGARILCDYIGQDVAALDQVKSAMTEFAGSDQRREKNWGLRGFAQSFGQFVQGKATTKREKTVRCSDCDYSEAWTPNFAPTCKACGGRMRFEN